VRERETERKREKEREGVCVKHSQGRRQIGGIITQLKKREAAAQEEGGDCRAPYQPLP